MDRPGPVAGTSARPSRPVAEAAAAVAARPWLWPAALRQAVRLAPSGWWRHRPFLPVPDRAYLAFRMETMYGDRAHPAVAADVVAYLRWCRTLRHSLRRGR